MAIPCWGCRALLPDGVTYCPRCGATVGEDSQTELDATRISPTIRPGSLPPQSPRTYPGSESLPPQAATYRTSPPPAQSRAARTALALGVAFAVVIALGVLAGVFGDRLLSAAGLGADPKPPVVSTGGAATPVPQPSQSATAATTATKSTPVTSKPPSSAASANPSTKPPQTTRTVTVYQVTVARTCGGNGDCYLTERSLPTSTSESLKRWPEKSTLGVVCQVHGQSVTSAMLNRSSTVWSRTTTGGYVANIFLDGIDAFSVTTAC